MCSRKEYMWKVEKTAITGGQSCINISVFLLILLHTHTQGITPPHTHTHTHTHHFMFQNSFTAIYGLATTTERRNKLSHSWKGDAGHLKKLEQLLWSLAVAERVWERLSHLCSDTPKFWMGQVRKLQVRTPLWLMFTHEACVCMSKCVCVCAYMSVAACFLWVNVCVCLCVLIRVPSDMFICNIFGLFIIKELCLCVRHSVGHNKLNKLHSNTDLPPPPRFPLQLKIFPSPQKTV